MRKISSKRQETPLLELFTAFARRGGGTTTYKVQFEAANCLMMTIEITTKKMDGFTKVSLQINVLSQD